MFATPFLSSEQAKKVSETTLSTWTTQKKALRNEFPFLRIIALKEENRQAQNSFAFLFPLTLTSEKLAPPNTLLLLPMQDKDLKMEEE